MLFIFNKLYYIELTLTISRVGYWAVPWIPLLIYFSTLNFGFWNLELGF